MTIAEFLTARLDEDEAVARKVLEKIQPRRTGTDPDYYEDAEGSAASIIWDVDYNQGGYTITAERVLAEVAAKRAIVAEYVREEAANFGDQFLDGLCSGLERSVRLLAQPYAEHPDFDPAWRVA